MGYFAKCNHEIIIYKKTRLVEERHLAKQRQFDYSCCYEFACNMLGHHTFSNRKTIFVLNRLGALTEFNFKLVAFAFMHKHFEGAQGCGKNSFPKKSPYSGFTSHFETFCILHPELLDMSLRSPSPTSPYLVTLLV